MTDVFDRAKRSDVMAKIRGKGNSSTEMVVVRSFRAAKITGWRRHVTISFRVRAPTGTPATVMPEIIRVCPDFIFKKARIAIFVDGCFWHCCPLHFKLPENNRSFWEPKFQANVTRDKRATQLLRSAGWSVLRVWEHDLKDAKSFVSLVRRRLARRAGR